MNAPERVIPLLVYRDVKAAYDFLVNVLGFESAFVHVTAEGEALHAEVIGGGTTIWIHRASGEHDLASPQAAKYSSSGLVVHVPDVDAHYARTRAAGAQIDNEPTDQNYGQREYGLRDPEGHRWWFATPIPVAAAGKTAE